MEEVTLRDGARVAVRPVTPDDAPLFEAGFERFGEGSRYRRFLGQKRTLSPKEIDFFTHPDHHDHEAIGALDAASGEGIGVARYVRNPAAPETAEAAVAVVDAWQGRGIGALLLDRLATRAREEGVRRFVATLLLQNRAMLTLFERLGTVRLARENLDVAHIDVELPLAERERGALSDALRAAACGDVELAGGRGC